MVGFPDWQVAVETAQVVAGLVTYPADNIFFIYHTKLWTVLHQILAVAARRGRHRDHAVAGRQRRAGDGDVSGAGDVRLRVEPRRARRNRRRRADFFHARRRVRRRLCPFLLGTETPTASSACRSACSWWRSSAPAGIARARSLLGLAPCVHPSLGAWIGAGRRDLPCSRISAGFARTSAGAAVVCGGLRRHARQPVDSVQPRTDHPPGMRGYPRKTSRRSSRFGTDIARPSTSGTTACC